MSGLLFIWIVKTILASNACGSPQAICASSVFVATNASLLVGRYPKPSRMLRSYARWAEENAIKTGEEREKNYRLCAKNTAHLP